AVVGGGHVQVPDALEVGRVLVVAAGGGAQEGERGAVVVARGHGGEDDVLDAEGRADVRVVQPRPALVVADGDPRGAVAVLVAHVDGPAGADSHARVGVGGGAGRALADGPRQPVVLGHGHGLVAAAALVGHLHRAVRGDLH